MGPDLALATQWFDGSSPRAQAATVHIEGGVLVLQTATETRRYALTQVRWPERRTHGQRQTDLPDGSLVQHADAPAWDAWWQANGLHDSPVVKSMQSWRGAMVAVAGSVLVLAAAWVWGVPWLSSQLAALVPAPIEAAIGQRAYTQLERLFLRPSQLPATQQSELQQAFAGLVQRARRAEGVDTLAAQAASSPAQWTLHLHDSADLGPNAFALPGGTVVVTDALVKLLQDDAHPRNIDTLLGVMAHELGHLKHRHGLDMMVRASLVGALVGVVLGDASSLLASVPATLVTRAYSRDVERQADAYAAQLLYQSGIAPQVMVRFFERIERGSGPDQGRASSLLPIAIASHPNHAERSAFFNNWKPLEAIATGR